MNFNKYLSLRNILAFSSLNYIQAALSFVISMVLARVLGAELYGYYTYGIVFNTTVFILVQFGLDKTLVRDLVQKRNVDHLIWASSFLKLGLSVLALVGVVIWSIGFSEESALKAYIAILFTASGVVYGISPRAWFDYTGQIQQHARLMLFERVFFFLGTLSILFLYEAEHVVWMIAVVLLIGRFLMSLMEWRYVRRTVRRVRFKYLRRPIRDMVFRNSWVWLAALSNLCMTHVNQFVLDAKLGTDQLGYYGLAFQLIMLVQLLQSQVLRLATPSIAQTVNTGSGREIQLKYRRDMLLCIGVTVMMLVPIYYASPWLIKLLVGSEYLGALPVLRVLCFWSLVYGVALINNQYLLSFHLQRPYFYTTLFFGAVSLYLADSFIGYFGLLGAALSLLISHAGSVAVQSIMVIFQIHKHESPFKKSKNSILSKEAKFGVTRSVR